MVAGMTTGDLHSRWVSGWDMAGAGLIMAGDMAGDILIIGITPTGHITILIAIAVIILTGKADITTLITGRDTVPQQIQLIPATIAVMRQIRLQHPGTTVLL